MVSKKEKEKMKNFFLGRLEDSLRYNIKSVDNSHIIVEQKKEIVENPAEIYVILHNKKMTIKEYKRLIQNNNNRKIYTTDLFYKDENNFMIRLGARGHFKGDMKSLKNYSQKELNNIVHLRELEKKAIESQAGIEELVYYQPKSDRLTESIRRYKMNDVVFDYSHLTPQDHGYGFAKPGKSLDYKLTNEIPEKKIITSPVIFKKASKNTRKLLPEPGY
ncbi:MAG: hypothetical protein ACOCQG_03735 [Candidatus Nanoarchaeia archaeon]